MLCITTQSRAYFHNRSRIQPGMIFMALFVCFTGCESFNLESMGSLLGQKELTSQNIVDGLREALTVGTRNAVKTTSADGGYFKNPLIRIPLPEKLEKLASTVRRIGLGGQVDQFKKKMNQAAEKAAELATPVFVDAIRNMSFSDAKEILHGGDTAAMDYFRDATSPQIRELYRPLVNGKMEEVGGVKLYNNMITKYNRVPLTPAIDFDIEEYVTDKAMKGLFAVVADEEREIRENPAARTTALLKMVFATTG
jgi:hypothetical protein